MMESVQMDQQKKHIRTGLFEWKVKRALESVNELNSPMFTFGGHESFLKLRYEFSSANGHESRNLNIDLHIVKLLHSFALRHFIKAYFMSYNRYEHFIHTVYVDSYSTNKSLAVMSLTADDMDTKNFKELSKEGAFTFRLAWMNEKLKKKADRLKEANSSTDKLVKDFKVFYENRTNTDSVLKVSGKEFPVHRAILCARSSVFEAMFRPNTSQSQSVVVEISGVDAVAMNNVLHYIYTGEIPGLTPETAALMYTAADKYALAEMRNDCLGFLGLNLTMENIGDAIQLAGLHVVPEVFEEKITLFIENNARELKENDKWKVFSKKNPSLALKYFHFALISANEPKATKPRTEHDS